VLPGLTSQHDKTYSDFYNSTKRNEHLSPRETLLVGLAAAMGVNCIPCQRFYLQECKKAGISKGDVSEVLAKVMAVSSGQKRLQFQEVLDRYGIKLDDFDPQASAAPRGAA
jgi:alkylhydroperoxidase/carboxymuconolactone decarboxylase family protein YurZ